MCVCVSGDVLISVPLASEGSVSGGGRAVWSGGRWNDKLALRFPPAPGSHINPVCDDSSRTLQAFESVTVQPHSVCVLGSDSLSLSLSLCIFYRLLLCRNYNRDLCSLAGVL